jgi:hypothetical protein
MNNPEAIPKVKKKHLRTLERRRNFLLAKLAQKEDVGPSYEKAEVAALNAVLAHFGEAPEALPTPVVFKVGDQVKILVGGPHENCGRIATVGRIQENGDAVIYFDDQDEDEWIYSPNELAKVKSTDWRRPK